MSTFARPGSVDEMLQLMDSEGRTPMAGATDIYPAAVGSRLAGGFVDLTGVAELRGIERRSDVWRIGATTTWTDILKADLPDFMVALQLCAAQIGGVQIQNVATVAGNLVTASPAGDSIPVLLSMDARVELARKGHTRSLPLEQFIVGYRETALNPGEVVTAIEVPHIESARSSFQKLGSRSHLVISIVMVSAVVSMRDDVVSEVGISVGACSPVARRISGLEDAIRGAPAGDFERIVDNYVFDELAPIDDIRATASYRQLVVPRLVRRALADCVES